MYKLSERAYHSGRTSHWCFCWVCSWEVYNRLDCQSVTLEHTRSHRVLCQSPPDDCHAADVDPKDKTIIRNIWRKQKQIQIVT